MSLSRKLMLAVTVLVLVLLTGNLLISIVNARQYFSEQMQSLTEDAATSLGFSLSHMGNAEDQVLSQTMIDAIFDRGHYRSIVFTGIDNEVIASRNRPPAIENVPVWFVDAIEIPQRAGVAEVVSGWYRLGEVSIIAHPGYAYLELWRVFKEQLWLFLFAVVMCYGLAGLGLKYLLGPLQKIEQQALAISRKDFVEQPSLPSTHELRRIVDAMNLMARKIREMFQYQVDLSDQYRRDASMDSLTQLPNREEFDRQFQAWLGSEEGGGPVSLIITHVENLAELNDRAGRESVNQLLCGIADVYRQALSAWPRALASRRQGGDFVMLVPALLQPELETFVKKLNEQFEELFTPMPEMLADHLFLGAVTTTQAVEASALLSAGDSALRQAIVQRMPRWCIESADSQARVCLPARAWVDRIHQALAGNDVELCYQPIFSREREPLRFEVFARLRDEGESVNAGVFWPIAERFHLVEDLDKRVLKLALQTLEKHPEAELCVNISAQSLLSRSFMGWLRETLLNANDVTRLNLELPERLFRMHEESLDELLVLTQSVGVKVGLDHFGLVPSALGCLQKLPLSYVKIDRQFVHAYRHQALYLKILAQIAKASDVQVLIEGIESEEQWQAALDAGADLVQGYWLAKPSQNL